MFKPRHPLSRHRLERREGGRKREGEGGKQERERERGKGEMREKQRKEKRQGEGEGDMRVEEKEISLILSSLDAGKVIKVVIGSRGSGMTDIFPVIVEEISLDNDNNIEKMTIHPIAGHRYLFVNTHSKIYKFPLARCSRHKSCM